MLKRLLYLLILLCAGCHCVSAQVIQDLRLAANDAQNVRFVVDLSEQTEIRLSHLTTPPRLVIDVQKAAFAPGVATKQFDKKGFIASVRTGNPTLGTSRIVLDLPTDNITEKHFTLPPQAGSAWYGNR